MTVCPVDCDMTFEDYKNQIIRVAEQVEVNLEQHTKAQYIKGAQKFYQDSVELERCMDLEGAFLGYWRTVHLFRQLNSLKDPCVEGSLVSLEKLANLLRPVYECRMEEVHRQETERHRVWEDNRKAEEVVERSSLFSQELKRRGEITTEEGSIRKTVNAHALEGYRHLLLLEKAAQSEAMRQTLLAERAERDRRTRELMAAVPAAPPAAPTPVFRQQSTIVRKCDAWVFPNKSPSVPRRGLVNLGNTCYMNAALQCLNSVPGFRQKFLQNQALARCGPVSGAYSWIVSELRVRTAGHALSPAYLKNAVAAKDSTFGGTSQQDSHEFLRVLLDSMHEEQRPTSKGPNTQPPQDLPGFIQHYLQTNDTAVSRSFGYFEGSTLSCPKCNNVSRTYTPTFTLLLPIPNQAKTLYDCIGSYTAKEELPVDSQWTCSGCKTPVRAVKQLSFVTTPNTLMITLVRFRSVGALSNKVTNPIIFPQVLELGETQYRLVGTTNHQGTIAGGHYTADCVGVDDDAWLGFSDERIFKCALQPQWSLAYVLYYVAVKDNICGLVCPPNVPAQSHPLPTNPQQLRSQPPPAPTNGVAPMEDLAQWISQT